MKRLISHWTGGGNRANAKDRKHYHRLVEYDGTIVEGTEGIEDNIVTSDGDYARHTLNLNTQSIGVALCGMLGATERPFYPGPSPITERQWHTFCILISDLCREYSIPITPETVLTHAEVESTLGVKQRGKWDLTRLPHRPELRGSRAVGDHMRALVQEAFDEFSPPVVLQEPAGDGRYLLAFGSKGPLVFDLQARLKALRHFPGKIDGDFGRLTGTAVRGFQKLQGLLIDGKVGENTWAALDVAEPAPLRAVSPEELILTSRTAAAAKSSEGAGNIGLLANAGVLGSVTLGAVNSTLDTADQAKGTFARIIEMAGSPAVAIGLTLLGLALFLVVKKRGKAGFGFRLGDAQSGKNLG